MPDRPPPPAPAPAKPCIYGATCGTSIGWRWYRTGWERACDIHRGHGQLIPDIVNPTKQERT